MKILIVAPNWVGDVVIAQALLRLIKNNHPQAVIHVLVRKHLSALLECMPEVNEILISPVTSGKLNLKEQFIFARKLCTEKYDQAIVLPNSFKSALIPFFADIPKRTGWLGEMRVFLLNDIRFGVKKFPTLLGRFLFLGIGGDNSRVVPAMPKLIASEEDVEDTLQKFDLTCPKRLLALCPGAEYGEAKCWPAAYFAEIAKILAPRYQIWLFGGNNDQAITAEIQNLSGNICVNLAGKTSLKEAVDLMSLATAVITNDSGLMHIAAALEKPLVAIYGSSSPKFTPPLTKKVEILCLNLACSPCFKRECPLKHLRCLKEITPKMVLDALEKLNENSDR